MLSDGYYAAAAQGSTAQPVFGQPVFGSPGSGPSASGQAAFGQPGLGQSAFGPRGPATPPSHPVNGTTHAGAYPSQAGSYPGQGGSYPGQGGSYPGQQDALAQYAPGRRKPTAAEVPPDVLIAVRLMYAGFVTTALDVLLSLLVLGRYVNAADNARSLNHPAVMHAQNVMAGSIAIGLIADVLGLACWAWLAVAARRGNGWTRAAGTVLLVIYSVCTLFVLFGTHRDPGPQFTSVIVWAIGVATIIPLWSQQARDFFFAWRKR